ncbi:MAG: LPS export ABC transporter periplasmic protein LptC [Aquificaceae bacterium]|nr:LPS export ABC transporter periplasmic protein LptC [Aquificaceae bacterium]
MLRSFLISLFLILIAYALRMYVEGFKPLIGREEMINALEGVTIRSYGKGGLEWTIRGKRLEVVGRDVKLVEAELQSKEATIRAKEAHVDRSTGKGWLLGDVLLLSNDTRVKSQKVYMDLKEGEFRGEDRVEIYEEKSRIEGEGFHLSLKPLRIIINRAKVSME